MWGEVVEARASKKDWGQGVLTHEPDTKHVCSVLIRDGNEKQWMWEVGGCCS